VLTYWGQPSATGEATASDANDSLLSQQRFPKCRLRLLVMMLCGRLLQAGLHYNPIQLRARGRTVGILRGY